MTPVLENSTPLKPHYLPQRVVDREDEQEALTALYSNPSGKSLRNVFIHGPRGTGKTHLTHLLLSDLSDNTNTCYVPCTQFDTQYKVLKHLCNQMRNKSVNNGYHTSQLEHQLKEYTRHAQAIVVLDDIEFLLRNDGDSLLYFLSRMDHSDNIGLVTISSNHEDLASRLEERTYSSLYPQRIGFDSYSVEEKYQILLERAQQSLSTRSLRREALNYIAETNQNVALALTWLKTVAEKVDSAITENHVQEVRGVAFQNYVNHLIEPFTEHHKLVYQAIEGLAEEESNIQSGSIYNRYQELCQRYAENSLSNRRISDYIKHLELLNLIEADYHYGGEKGKTREINLRFQ